MPSLDTEVRRSLRRVVLVVAALNLAYFAVELTVALRIGSVSLYADSVDFLEDTAINVLIALALGMSLRVRSMAGEVMAAIILVPALAAAYEAFTKARSPEPPDVLALVLTAGGWPDIVLGVLIVVLNLGAAHEVWEASEEERLAAKVLAGEPID